MRGEIFSDPNMGIEAFVGLGRYPGASAPVAMIAVRLKGLGGSDAQLRFGPFRGESEAKVAFASACMQVFGRAPGNRWKESSFPAWSFTALLCLFPSPVGAAVGAAMITSMCKSVDAGRDPQAGVQEVWRKASVEVKVVSAPAMVSGQKAQPASEVVLVSSTQTAEPWSPMVADQLSPLGFLKAKWFSRPRGLDIVLSKLGR